MYDHIFESLCIIEYLYAFEVRASIRLLISKLKHATVLETHLCDLIRFDV